MRTRLGELARDRAGSAIVEFGMLGGLFIALLIGVFQIGVALQSYNAMRSVSADVARTVTVQYQTGNELTNSQIQNLAVSTATGAPYLLESQNLTATATDATVQRVAGAREITMQLQYQVPSFLTLFGFTSPALTFSRPIFVLT